MSDGFNSLARSAFKFLAESYGLWIMESRSNYLRFENEDVIVVISYDNTRSYEINLDLGIQKQHPNLFSFDEFLRSRQVPLEEMPEGYQVKGDEAIDQLVFKMADLLQRYGSDLLHGNIKEWRCLSELRLKESLDYAKKHELNHVKAEAESAWKAKEYERFIRILSPWQEHLSSSDLMRLEYAKSHSQVEFRQKKDDEINNPTVNSIISAWAARHGAIVAHVESHSEDIRSVDIVSPKGVKYQIRIDFSKRGIVAVHAWDYKMQRQNWYGSVEQLSRNLEEAIRTVKSWIGNGYRI